MALVSTIHGDLDDSLLERRTGATDGPSETMADMNERVEWVEYWLDGVNVHRSAHVTLTHAPAGAATGSI